MGNKLYVDNKITEINEILNFNVESLKITNDYIQDFESNSENFKNLKVWRFYETCEDKIISESIKLTKIKEDRFLLSSHETYIILIIFKTKDDNEEMSVFPNSLWGVVESSSNMTPRGLKYAFSTSTSENLESFLLSRRDFKNSEYKYLLFIWNGKNCAPLLKSNVLMKAFDLDKKLSNPIILPYLYYGYNIEGEKFIKNTVVNLNQIINNKFENLTEEPSTPSTESFMNFHETVYLLQLLYPKKMNKKNKIPTQNKKNLMFNKFNKNFLTRKNKTNYYDNFINLDNYLNPNSKRSQYPKENLNEVDTFSLRRRSKVITDREEYKSEENNQENEEENSEEIDDDDLNDDLYYEDVSNRGMKSKIQNNFNLNQNFDKEKLLSNSSRGNNNNQFISFNNEEEIEDLSNNKENNTRNNINNFLNNENFSFNEIEKNNSFEKNINSKKLINLSENINQNNFLKINLVNSDKNSNKNNVNNKGKPQFTEIKVPKLIMGIQHKILNEDLISQRIIQQTVNEEKLDNLPDSVIKKSADKIVTLKKLDMKNLMLNQSIKMNESKNNYKLNLEKLDITKINEDFNIRDSDRKHIVMDYFSKNISEILENFIYISNYTIAKNREIVFENKISHIINAAADVCQNHFLDDGITYTNYYLKDHPMENIECLFYEVIEIIEKVKEKNGRILIHCNQGISRSVTLVLAYLIFSKKMNYDEAFKFVQEKRSIASPNLGFSIQLQNFYQRMHEPAENYRLNPKIFAIGSFQTEQPDRIVCRMMNEPFFEIRLENLIKKFDKRGVFIICTIDAIYLWIGSRILENVKKV